MGGVERGTVEIATYMQQHGIKNFVASQGGRMVYDLEKAKVPHLTLPLKSKNIFKMRANAKKLEQFIRDNGINIVHARSRAPAWSAYWAAKKAGVSRRWLIELERGHGNAQIGKVLAALQALGLTLEVVPHELPTGRSELDDIIEGTLR